MTGIDRWLDEIVDLATPLVPERRVLMAPQEARERIGMIAHAVQDFFSHSNYVELGLPPPPPGFLLAACDPTALGTRLQTGYFSAAWAASGAPGSSRHYYGCPPWGPPPPFRFCHFQLNKDDPGRPNHAPAVAHAQLVTHSILDEIRRRVRAKFSADETIDVECIMMKLIWRDDEKRTCHRKWVVEGTVTTSVVDPSNWGYPVGQVALANVTLRIHWEPMRYVPPPALVDAVVWIEAETRGPVEITLTWPTNCQRTTIPWSSSGELGPKRGKLKVTPEEQPIETLSNITLALPDVMDIACQRPFQWLNFSHLCVMARGIVIAISSQSPGDLPFRCGTSDRRNVTGNRFIGTMRVDR